MTTIALDIATPAVFEPLLAPARYKGARGGRGSGKSHFFAEKLVEEHVADPNQRSVCIREVQKSLKFSAKALIEAKIRTLGVSGLFAVTETEIRRVGGTGIIIFVGMQDHTADSIKSLEGFDRAWVEEAQNLSARSLKLLRPTIRKPGSELWFSWNPEDETDPVDVLFMQEKPDGAACVSANYTDNPFCPATLKQEARDARAHDLDEYAHVWLGAYNKKSKARILADRCVVEAFVPAADWSGPYHGADFGFANDAATLVRTWIHDGRLWIERESYQVGLEIDKTAERWKGDVPGCERYVIRADNARPETISYLKRGGDEWIPADKRNPLPKIEGADKWSGSVEDGIAHLRGYKSIVLHERCENAQREARLYSFKVDKRTEDVLPIVVDAHNHIWDAVRYALAPIIKAQSAPRAWVF